MNLPITDTAFIEKLLPQKPPFVMVSELVDFSEKKLVSALAIGKENLLAKNGTFTEAGVLEHQAQSIALHAGFKNFQQETEPWKGYIAMIKKTEISSLPKIGERITSELEIIGDGDVMTTVKIITRNLHGQICETEMKTVFVGDE